MSSQNDVIDHTTLEKSLFQSPKPIDLNSLEKELLSSNPVKKSTKKKPIYTANIAYPSMFANKKIN